MPPRKPTTSSGNNIRGPVAILFMILIFVVYFFQEWKKTSSESGSDATTPGAPAEITSAPAIITSAPPATQTQATSAAITIFFTDPLSGASSGGIENNLVAAIDGARKTVDVAIYNISLPNVTDALIAAHERGVLVRMTMESEAMDGKSAQRLMEAGIEIIGDNREGLMHNKFVVIDGLEVWTGSFNFTRTSAYEDFNNLIQIRSQRAAQNYTVEFNECFEEGLFGPAGEANTPYPTVTIDGIQVEFYFSPDDGVTDQIVAELLQAKQSIVIMAYSFTSDPLADVINTRIARRVKVRGVFDESQYYSNQGGEYDALLKAGFDVKLDGISGLQHSKVFIIDGKTVIAGSFNFSANAERYNDENIVIIHDAVIATQYLMAFEPMYRSAK